MPFRAMVVDNLRWKLTALMLALLVWCVIRFSLYSGTSLNQVLLHQPVMVLKTPIDPRTFRIQPPEVTVVLQANKQLHAADIEAFIDLTSMPDVDSAFKRV